MSRLRIRTPSRLHFGLFGWGPDVPRQFGGVGLMIEKPGLEIVAEPARDWEATGPGSERVFEVVGSIVSRLGEQGFPLQPLRLTTLHAPNAHVGLGVGTQLGLAVARLLTELAGLPQTPLATLARLSNRGLRSGIGIHGFMEGGFIIDAGRAKEQDLPTKVIRATFSGSWSVLVVVPAHFRGLHGMKERNAFRSIAAIPDATTDRLCRLTLLGLLPAVLETDLPAFGASLVEIQDLIGGIFAPVQGGPFALPEVEGLVELMSRIGLFGVGQSSWGPTLYGFSDKCEQERETLRKSFLRDSLLDSDQVFWTQASDNGAILQVD